MELEIIKEAQKGFIDIRSYWIGGSTYSDPTKIIEFNEYNPTASGSSLFNDYFGIWNLDFVLL